MIQRIQTLYFLIAAASFGALFIFPMAISDKPTAQFLADNEYDVNDHPALIGLTLLGVVVAMIAIFLFTKRPIQVKLGFGVIAMAILLSVASFLLFKRESATIDAAVQVMGQPGMFFPAGAILFGTLAIYAIRKDEKLVKSMDRLR
jgi:hypothetical protein